MLFRSRYGGKGMKLYIEFNDTYFVKIHTFDELKEAHLWYYNAVYDKHFGTKKVDGWGEFQRPDFISIYEIETKYEKERLEKIINELRNYDIVSVLKVLGKVEKI